jgi:3-hydroxyacyl-CoA dehydrogenase
MTDWNIERVVVIGAGTMGAAIAAHLANAGIKSTLLDIVPRELTEGEKAKGLTLEHPAVRNRIVNEGWQRCLKARPANLFSPSLADLVTQGNLEDDFGAVGEADWIIEAIVERLDIKQKLMARIDEVRKPHAIVSTNTSGIPVHDIAEGRSDSFKQHFLGTHFFNPPRYLKLLEIIPHEQNSPQLLEFMRHFCTRTLGKGVVFCKDTPNFIANRILSITGSFGINYALDHDYTVEEVDAITGLAIGRPKTATFRLNDLIGADVMAHVSSNLYEAIPHDPYRDALKHPKAEALIGGMVERGWLGNKTEQGFYRKTMVEGKKEFWILDPESFEYFAPKDPKFDSIQKGRSIDDTAKRLEHLAYAGDRAGEYVWHLLSRMVLYAASVVPEISDDIISLDNACKWGFMWELGPFETWDAIGVRGSVERMQAEGLTIPAWVEKMLQQGIESFYQVGDGGVMGYYDLKAEKYVPMPVDPDMISISAMKAQGKELHSNDSAGLLDMGDGVLLLEFHNPKTSNALDDDVFAMAEIALQELAKPDWKAMVIGNQGKNFCVGANIFMMALAAQQGEYDILEKAVARLQAVLQRMRYSRKPVVAAPFGLVLGGGAEVVMAASAVVAGAESYIGLVEVGLGLIPAGTGTTQLVKRIINPVMEVKGGDVLPHMQKVFEQIALGKVAESALLAREMGYLQASDHIVMNQDYLLAEAKRKALSMASLGHWPMPARKVWAAGRDVLADLKMAVWSMIEARWASEHDGVVANQLAYVLTGGDLSAPDWVPEEYMLELERKGFVELAKQPKTQERMWYMLQHKKPLRN